MRLVTDPASAEVARPGDARASVPLVGIVPTAPLLLPAVSPRQPSHLVAPVADLRAAVRTTLTGVVTTEVVVLVAADARAGVHRHARVDRTPSGHPQAQADVATDGTVAATLAAAIGRTVDDAAPLSGDLAVLASLVADVAPDVRVVPVTLDAQATDLAGLAAVLRRVCVEHGAALVVAGDLAATRDATSPGYVVDGAVAFDDAAVAALRTGDAAMLEGLGTAEATRVRARGYVPVAVAAAVVGGPWPEVALVAPRGVGLLVAASVATGTVLPDAPHAVLAAT